MEETFRCCAISTERVQNLKNSPANNPFELPSHVEPVWQLDNAQQISTQRAEQQARTAKLKASGFLSDSNSVNKPTLTKHSSNDKPNRPKSSSLANEPINRQRSVKPTKPLTIKEKLIRRAIDSHSTTHTIQATKYFEVKTTANFLNSVLNADFNSLMYIVEQRSKVPFLIDTGSQISVVPAESGAKPDVSPKFKLTGADNSRIATYGRRRIKLKFGDQTFTHNFIVADVKECILGIDFLRAFQFTINPYDNQITNSDATIQCETVQCNSKCLKLDFTDPILKLLEETPEITDTSISSRSTPSHGVVHFITTVGGPCKACIRRYNPTVQKIINDTFSEYLKLGYVRYSSSDWSSPLAVSKKKDGSYRVCGDYRMLNKLTKNDNYNLPYLQSFNNQMEGCTRFTKIDLEIAFIQVPIHPPDIPKTAVCTPQGLFEFTRMNFGMKTSSQTFQRFLDTIFRDFSSFLFIFINDLVIHSRSESEHLEHLRKVFRKLADHNLKINIKKCQFNKEKIDFLGFTVSDRGVLPSDNRVNSINNAPIPTTVAKMKKFLGTTSYYHHYMKNFAKIRQPLNSFLSVPKRHNDRKIHLTSRQIEAFHQLNESLANATILAHPVPGATLLIHTDASGISMGATLSQLIDGKPQPLYLFSRLFSERFLSRTAYDKELEAAYQAIKKFDKFLLGQKVILYVDNQALSKSLAIPKDKPWPEQRRLMFISQNVDEVIHIAGEQNVAADYLSRLECNELKLEPKIDYAQLFNEQLTDPIRF